MSQRCNGISNCKDNFDETNCNMIIIDQQLYQKEIPPRSKDNDRLNILVNVSIFAIEGFNEIDMKFRIKFFLSLKWYVFFQIFLFIICSGFLKQILLLLVWSNNFEIRCIPYFFLKIFFLVCPIGLPLFSLFSGLCNS